MILNDVVTEVRRIVQDTNTPQRYSDTVLIGFANQALKRIAVLRPDLFAFIGDITNTADTVVQSMPSDSIRLIEIYNVKDGNGITETNRESLNQAYPKWMNEHVNSKRAQIFQQSFTQSLGVAAQSREVTDTERGGLDEEDVT